MATNMKDYSKFMTQLIEKLLERGLAQGTASMYITKLKKLNGNKPFSSLSFLKNNKRISEELDKIENYHTRKSYVASIVSVLGETENKQYQPLKTYYRGVLEDMKRPTSETKTEKQKENWLEWDDVVNKYKEMSNKEMNDRELEDHLILSFYVLQPPRRNDDYYLLKLDETGKADDEDFNYYRPKTNEFVFNHYKTRKTYGVDKIKLNTQMKNVIDNYISKVDIKNGDFILHRRSGNMITKSLNKIFGKKIGASMLRHIYLTSKYGDVKEDMKEDAEAMGHSVSQQKEYILK